MMIIFLIFNQSHKCRKSKESFCCFKIV